MAEDPVRRGRRVRLPDFNFSGPRVDLPSGESLDILARGRSQALPAGLGTRAAPGRAFGPAAGAPSDGIAQLPKTADVPPYWLYKPPEGVDFYFNQEGVLPAGAGSTLILTATPPIFVRPTYEAVVASVNIFVDAPNTGLGAVWTLRFNESPVEGWDSLRSFARIANNLSIEFSGNVQVKGGTKIDVLVSNTNANGPWTVGVEVTGWQWPRLARERTFGFGDSI